jgi:RNA polymerase sigma-70 factor (ECF subfamily)
MTDDARQDAFESGLKPLWLRAQAGDEAAYRLALAQIAARVRGYLRRRLQGLPDDVEDLVQETLLALHLQRGTYDPAVPVTAWVLAIARHKLVDLWRRRGRREDLHQALDEVDESALVHEAQSEGAQRDLGKLLDALPAAQRQAIVLTKVEGLSVAEASLRTGASVAAIKVQVHRGLKRLALLVKEAGA